MKTFFIPHQLTYDGSQITSLWAYRKYQISGDSIIAFIGPCRIPLRYMVDLNDLAQKRRIYSRKMLHFIIELFERDLEKAILYQRLLATIIQGILEKKIKRQLVREGDDLFDVATTGSVSNPSRLLKQDQKAKLSISVATLTLVSAKIHFGINIDSQGTPVVTKGLSDYKIPPERFARQVMKQYQKEYLDIKDSRYKVRGVT